MNKFAPFAFFYIRIEKLMTKIEELTLSLDRRDDRELLFSCLLFVKERRDGLICALPFLIKVSLRNENF